MKPEQYREYRETYGTQVEAAKKLGISVRTLQSRESGAAKITYEQQLAILALAREGKVSGPTTGRVR